MKLKDEKAECICSFSKLPEDQEAKTSLETGMFKGELQKDSMLDDVIRKPVAPTFWVEKLLADYLLEFSFHF